MCTGNTQLSHCIYKNIQVLMACSPRLQICYPQLVCTIYNKSFILEKHRWWWQFLPSDVYMYNHCWNIFIHDYNMQVFEVFPVSVFFAPLCSDNAMHCWGYRQWSYRSTFMLLITPILGRHFYQYCHIKLISAICMHNAGKFSNYASSNK